MPINQLPKTFIIVFFPMEIIGKNSTRCTSREAAPDDDAAFAFGQGLQPRGKSTHRAGSQTMPRMGMDKVWLVL
jgi:hypothetical protein